MRVVKSDKANKDLLNIYVYLANRNVETAEAIIRNLDIQFRRLAKFPFLGRERSQFGKGMHSIVVGEHLIFYAVFDEVISVVRVIDGRMDVDVEFQR